MNRFAPRVIQAFKSAGLPSGLQIRNAADCTEIMVYGPIGDFGYADDVIARDFLAALAKTAGGPVRVRVNSPGGNVFDGMSMYNALRAHPGPVTCQVDGIAASAASFLICAAESIVMGEASMLMIHNASTVAWGDKRAFAAEVAVLDKVDGQIAAIYASRSGKDASTFATLMDAETYLTAQEAINLGLATAIAAPPAKVDPPADPVEVEDSARQKRLRMLRYVSATS